MTFREIIQGSGEQEEELALRRELLRLPLGLDLLPEELAAESSELHFGLFEDSGRLAGCAVARLLDPGEARIRQMAVRPEHQGKGHGARLLQAIEGLLAVRGIVRIHLHARAAAEGFYRKHGYEPAGGAFIEVGIPHVRMEKELDGPERDPGAAR